MRRSGLNGGVFVSCGNGVYLEIFSPLIKMTTQ